MVLIWGAAPLTRAQTSAILVQPQSLIKLAKPIQFGGEPMIHVRPHEAPGPLSVAASGKVHSMAVALIEHVLHWQYYGIGHTDEGCANQIPVDGVAIGRQIFAQMLTVGFGRGAPPAQ